MGLTYNDLYSHRELSKRNREKMYKENSNVLAYYVIKTILIFHYQDFLLWCKTHNFSLIQFHKTNKVQIDFCHFIKEYHKKSGMLTGISHAHKFLMDIHKTRKTSREKKMDDLDYIVSNLRMSICELE